jgi:hypothetical protein
MFSTDNLLAREASLGDLKFLGEFSKFREAKA